MDKRYSVTSVIFFIIFFFQSILCETIDQIEISADKFTHDKNNKIIYAVGRVEVVDQNYKIYSDELIYNTENKIISAKKNIRIFSTNGNIIRTEDLVSDNKLENAKSGKSFFYIPEKNNFEIEHIQENERDKSLKKLKRYSRFASMEYERRGGSWEIFRNAVFSACDICFNEKDNKFEEPLLQLKARKILHDKEKKVIEYKDTFFEISGQPVFYLPYFSHPSPGVKRKSGFLTPSYFRNVYLGDTFVVPYYYVINNHHDLTIKPRFHTNRNPLFFMEHRKNFSNGEIKNEISNTFTKTGNHEELLGHIESYGKFNLNNNTNLRFQIHKTTDRHFLQAYKLNYEDLLETNINIERLLGNNYYALDIRDFQDLRPVVNNKGTPTIFPRLNVNLNSDYEYNSFNNSSNLEILNLQRKEGAKMQKFFVMHSLQYPLLAKDGSIYEFGGHLNAGIYKINNYDNPLSGIFKEDYNRYRFFPQITFQYSKPFYKRTKKTKQILEPKMLLVGAPNTGYDLHIPNEDSSNFDLDIPDLFNRNRLSGTDRFDSGSRVDYGFNYVNINTIKNSLTSISLGQSYSLKKDVFASSNSGTNNYFSNLLGSIKINPTDLINISSNFSIVPRNGSLSYAISNISFGSMDTRFNINHLLVSKTDGIESTMFPKRNQISSGFSTKINRNWKFSASTNFNLKKEIKFQNWNTKILYVNECFGFSLNWTRQYTYIPEDPTANYFEIKFTLKEIMESDL